MARSLQNPGAGMWASFPQGKEKRESTWVGADCQGCAGMSWRRLAGATVTFPLDISGPARPLPAWLVGDLFAATGSPTRLFLSAGNLADVSSKPARKPSRNTGARRLARPAANAGRRGRLVDCWQPDTRLDGDRATRAFFSWEWNTLDFEIFPRTNGLLATGIFVKAIQWGKS